MSAPTSKSIVAEMRNCQLVATEGEYEGQALTTTGAGIGRQVNSLPNGRKLRVVLEGKKVVSILENTFQEEHRANLEAKAATAEDVASALATKNVHVTIQAQTSFHELPGNEDRVRYLQSRLATKAFNVVGVKGNKVMMTVKVNGTDWTVVGYIDAESETDLDLSLSHFGEGSL